MFFLAKIEKWVRSWMPEALDIMFTPLLSLVITVIPWLAAQGWQVLADISRRTLEVFEEPNTAALAKALHLWGLRIDDGFTVEEICALAAKLPVAVNASTVTAADAARIAAAGPQVMAMHNFYPRPETGLDKAFLQESTDALHAAGLQLLGFVPGDCELRGPVFAGLPTL